MSSNLPTLIIRDQLVGPPTWPASFRDLTLFVNIFIKPPIVIESPDPDPYYRWLRPIGGMDFVSDFVSPNSEKGLRLDIQTRFGVPTVIVAHKRIVPENVGLLISQIKLFYFNVGSRI